MWFGFLCAAKDKKAPLSLDQMLLQVSATNHDVASVSMNAPMREREREDHYSVMSVCILPMKETLCLSGVSFDFLEVIRL